MPKATIKGKTKDEVNIDIELIKNADYILRGYENITQKLQNIGAKIELREI